MSVKKIVSLDELLTLRAKWRAEERTVVFTTGCFDILHLGHIRYLQEAKALGDVLVVGLNSDVSVRHLKGALRPLIPQNERAEILAALSCLDYITLFEEPTAETLVASLQPEVYVDDSNRRHRCDSGASGKKEAHFGDKPIDAKVTPEGEIVTAYGGELAVVPYLSGYSTTKLIQTIVERYSHGSIKGGNTP